MNLCLFKIMVRYIIKQQWVVESWVLTLTQGSRQWAARQLLTLNFERLWDMDIDSPTQTCSRQNHNIPTALSIHKNLKLLYFHLLSEHQLPSTIQKLFYCKHLVSKKRFAKPYERWWWNYFCNTKYTKEKTT